MNLESCACMYALEGGGGMRERGNETKRERWVWFYIVYIYSKGSSFGNLVVVSRGSCFFVWLALSLSLFLCSWLCDVVPFMLPALFAFELCSSHQLPNICGWYVGPFFTNQLSCKLRLEKEWKIFLPPTMRCVLFNQSYDLLHIPKFTLLILNMFSCQLVITLKYFVKILLISNFDWFVLDYLDWNLILYIY